MVGPLYGPSGFDGAYRPLTGENGGCPASDGAVEIVSSPFDVRYGTVDSRSFRSWRRLRKRHHPKTAEKTKATEPPATIPPIAPALKEDDADGEGDAVEAGSRVGMTTVVADVAEDMVEVADVSNGLWFTLLVVVRTDLVYPGVTAHPYPIDPDA
ncbi:hypothetical protein MMC16_006696 [Acarospora aff. strigata]|nr:hypothetical protein [Acarospora aff. strigata]